MRGGVKGRLINVKKTDDLVLEGVPYMEQARPGVDPTACFELPAVLVVAHGIATQSVVQASPT